MRDLSNINTKEIAQIGFFQNEKSEIQVVRTIKKVPNLLLSEITSLEGMFTHTANFNQDISHWDTSNVTNMSDMFFSAWSFNQNIGNWNVTNVIEHNGFEANSAIDNANKLSKFVHNTTKFFFDWEKENVTFENSWGNTRYKALAIYTFNLSPEQGNPNNFKFI